LTCRDTIGRRDWRPDGRWILGIFYFDRNDPAMFIEKRFGIGYTMNMGRPASWIILIAALLVVPTVALLNIQH
jgi:uncharacterized membrane protein